MTMQRIDDGFEHQPIVCAHAWIVGNKCAWCGERIAAKPVVYDYACFPDEIETDELHCPNCGTNTRSRHCTSLFCEDGYIDEYEDDPINFAPGEEYSRCDECHGTGIERWCPNCGWQWRGEKLTKNG